MKNLIKKVRGVIGNEEGQGLVEYALVITLIVIVVIAALTVLGQKVNGFYSNAATNL